MDYGADKTKSMVESILPSKRRKGAREDRAAAHRKLRSQVRSRLGRLRYEDYDDFEISVTHNNNREIREMVWERRAGDKTEPLVRWAEAITKDIPKGKRVEFMRRLLPDNLIGRHALSHLVFLDSGFDHRRSYWATIAEERHRTHDDLVGRVRALLGMGAHADINIALKRCHTPGHLRNGWDWTEKRRFTYRDYHSCCERSPRLLGGAHDVESFVHDIMYSEHKEWKETLVRLMERLGV